MDKRDFFIYCCQQGIENDQLIKLETFLDENEIYNCEDIFTSDVLCDIKDKVSNSTYEKLKIYDKYLLDKVLDYCEKTGISILCPDDLFYPKSLKLISDYPRCLFVNGDINYDGVHIAIVGSRKHSTYSVNVVNYIVDALKDYDVTIVSGMAYGVDSLAHKRALENKMNTIAVLGCGVDVVYPKRNQRLYDTIAKSGAVISEYALGSSPLPYRFPQRNRIISGLSSAIIVTEARAKSGSLITARVAAEQGREVFAVPGNINSIYSEGTNLLIRDGANIFTNIDYFVELVDGLKGKQINKTSDLNLGEDESRVVEQIALGVSDISLISMNLKEDISFINGIITILELKDIVEINGSKVTLKIK